MEEDVSTVFSILVETLIFFLLVYTGTYFISNIKLNNINTNYSNIVAVYGGFAPELYEDFIEDLEKIGFREDETIINIVAKSPSGENLSNLVKNIEPLGTVGTTKFVPRGSKISIEISSNRQDPLTGVFKLLGATSSIKKGYDYKVVMSERVK